MEVSGPIQIKEKGLKGPEELDSGVLESIKASSEEKFIGARCYLGQDVSVKLNRKWQ